MSLPGNRYYLSSGYRRRRVWPWVVLAVVLVVAIGSILYMRIPNVSTNNAPVAKKVEPPAPKPVKVSGRYLFNGTIFWGRRIQQWSTKPDGSLNYAYPFSGLNTFDRAAYDSWEADLECPTSTTDVPVSKQEVQLVFNCKPEFLPEAAKFFDVINLANNHSDNLGRPGLDETRQAIIKNGMQPFGDYDPARTQDDCEIVALKVHITKDDSTTTSGNLPVAFCSWHYFYRLPRAGEIETMQPYAAIMPVFAFLHMGKEYQTKADPIQQSMAHRVADQGPEFVIANNPHWVQNSEVYNGKLIVYSTGNFIFDQQADAEVTKAASVDVKVSIKYDDNVGKWLKIGNVCATYKDDCLAQAKAQGLTKPKLVLNYDIVGGDGRAKLMKKGDASIQTWVRTRTNWNATLKALGQTQ